MTHCFALGVPDRLVDTKDQAGRLCGTSYRVSFYKTGLTNKGVHIEHRTTSTTIFEKKGFSE